MALTTGDKVPSCTLSVMGESGPAPLSTDDLFGGKRVLLFALPGAFTPGCSMAHLPGYVANADKIKAAGVDSIACLSVNDAFVMGAWGEAQNASEIVMVADGNAQFTDAMGLTLDATGFGMGKRSQPERSHFRAPASIPLNLGQPSRLSSSGASRSGESAGNCHLMR